MSCTEQGFEYYYSITIKYHPFFTFAQIHERVPKDAQNGTFGVAIQTRSYCQHQLVQIRRGPKNVFVLPINL